MLDDPPDAARPRRSGHRRQPHRYTARVRVNTCEFWGPGVDRQSKAALAALRGAHDAELHRLLLDHENQRFRFSYVLGRRWLVRQQEVAVANQIFDDIDEDDEFGEDARTFDTEPAGLEGIDMDLTAAILDSAIVTLRQLVNEHEAIARAVLSVTDANEERVAREIVDEELGKILRSDEQFNAVVDSLLGEIEKRFDALTPGTITRDRQGWPSTWSWETADREKFLRAVNRFSSNYAPLFGHLLSPLVDGIRVAGSFGSQMARRRGTEARPSRWRMARAHSQILLCSARHGGKDY